MRRSPAPTAKTISVRFGARETTRRGEEGAAAGGSARRHAAGTAVAAMKRSRGARRRPRRTFTRGASALGLGFFQIVGGTEAPTSGVVHLARRLLGILKLGQAILDLRELLLDEAFELGDLAFGDRQRVLVELLLVRRKAHVALTSHSNPGRTNDRTLAGAACPQALRGQWVDSTA